MAIKSGGGEDYIYNNDYSNVTITGGAGNDFISHKVLRGTITGGKGNDTLYGGDGSNIFVYQSGNDVIADFDSMDKIMIFSDKEPSYTVDKPDVTFQRRRQTNSRFERRKQRN